MKKIITLILSVLLTVGALTGCNSDDTSKTENDGGSSAKTEDNAADTKDLGTIRVGASPTPHGELLEAAKPVLAGLGYDLEIVEFNDYVLPNEALSNGELDANFFQHEPYLINFNEERGTDLQTAAYIHYEPLGLYLGKVATIEDLQEGDQIAVPNDGSNEGRALKLLEAQGLITLNDDVGLTATILDIKENPIGLEIIEVEAAQTPIYLKDVAMAVINGNYAIGAGLSVADDAIASEEKDSEAAVTYANVIAVEKGNEEREDIKALVEALKSDEVKEFIIEKYDGLVVAMD